MSAVIFGSIGTLADTSEVQRESFNAAFAEAGLPWEWSREEYRDLLRDSGGERRIAEYAAQRGDQVDAAALHRRKSELFRERLADGIAARPGVVETVGEARGAGLKLALVTTTAQENVDALTDALRPELDLEQFDLIVTVSQIEAPKPDPEAYRYALAHLHETAGDCVAIEDNVGGVTAATEAGLACVAFPGENNADHDFAAAAERLDALSLAALRAHLQSNDGARA